LQHADRWWPTGWPAQPINTLTVRILDHALWQRTRSPDCSAIGTVLSPIREKSLLRHCRVALPPRFCIGTLTFGDHPALCRGR
jgi:hypothetical protein